MGWGWPREAGPGTGLAWPGGGGQARLTPRARLAPQAQARSWLPRSLSRNDPRAAVFCRYDRMPSGRPSGRDPVRCSIIGLWPTQKAWPNQGDPRCCSTACRIDLMAGSTGSGCQLPHWIKSLRHHARSPFAWKPYLKSSDACF